MIQCAGLTEFRLLQVRLSFKIKKERKIRILALHGLWARSSVWNEFKKCFPEDEFLTPDIDWPKLSYEELRNQLSSFNPQLLIGHSFGGYVAQKLLEHYSFKVRLCVLIAPTGPRGIGFRSLSKIIMAFPWKFVKGNATGVFKIDDRHLAEKLMLGGLSNALFEYYYNRLVPEQTKVIMRAFPVLAHIRYPIQIPTLVVSGGLDIFVSKRDADAIAKFHKADRLHFSNLGHMLLTKSVAFGIRRWVKKQYLKFKV